MIQFILLKYSLSILYHLNWWVAASSSSSTCIMMKTTHFDPRALVNPCPPCRFTPSQVILYRWHARLLPSVLICHLLIGPWRRGKKLLSCTAGQRTKNCVELLNTWMQAVKSFSIFTLNAVDVECWWPHPWPWEGQALLWDPHKNSSNGRRLEMFCEKQSSVGNIMNIMKTLEFPDIAPRWPAVLNWSVKTI